MFGLRGARGVVVQLKKGAFFAIKIVFLGPKFTPKKFGSHGRQFFRPGAGSESDSKAEGEGGFVTPPLY